MTSEGQDSQGESPRGDAPKADHLDVARYLLGSLWLTALVALAFTLGIGPGRDFLFTDNDTRPDLVEALKLHDLALTPSGRPPRTLSQDAIDLRFIPAQPREERVITPRLTP